MDLSFVNITINKLFQLKVYYQVSSQNKGKIKKKKSEKDDLTTIDEEKLL